MSINIEPRISLLRGIVNHHEGGGSSISSGNSNTTTNPQQSTGGISSKRMSSVSSNQTMNSAHSPSTNWLFTDNSNVKKKSRNYRHLLSINSNNHAISVGNEDEDTPSVGMIRATSSVSLVTNDSATESRSSSQAKPPPLDKVLEVDPSRGGVDCNNKKRSKGGSSGNLANTNIQRHAARAVL